MADTIDSLQIQLSADAGAAEASLEKLADSLLKLKKNLSGLKWKNLSDFDGALKNLLKTTNSLNPGKITQYTNALSGLNQSVAGFSQSGKSIKAAGKVLNSISDLDFSKLQISGDFSGLESLGKGMDAFADSAAKLSQIKATDINRSVKALGKLQGINLESLGRGLQSISGADLSALNGIGTAFQGFTASLSGADKVSAGTSKIFNSLAQLSASAGNLSTVQQYLPLLSAEIGRFIAQMSQTPAVQAGTVAIVTALSGIATSGSKISKAAASLPALTTGVQGFVIALSDMPKVNNNTLRAVEALAKIAPAGAKAGTAAKSLKKNIDSLSASMTGLGKDTTGALGGLKSFVGQALSMLGIAGGIYAIGNAIKESITYSSDLAEAQNVVNQGFGSLAHMADDFAESALYSFGLSELQAKRTSGQFAAMARALGVVSEQAAEMSLSLTGLTGDLASFWNVSQDVAQTALESVFTGETESLKKFSVVMTQANLQQYAYSRGITKSISAMTEAEKAQLRYAYVMDATAMAQGDFASTSAGWANQVRILSGQFQTLAGIVGTGLVTAFLPVIRVVNQVLAAVIRLANGIASLLGGLFGFEGQTVSAGAGLADMAASADGVASGMEDAAGGIGDVGDAAKKSEKKLNGFIAGWHEVNNMTSGSDSSGGSGGASTGGVSMPDMMLPDEYEIDIEAEDNTSPVIDQIKQRFIGLRDLFLDGFYLGLGDTSVFDSIRQNIESIGQSMREIFTDGQVIDSFNSMLDALAYNGGSVAGSFVSVGATIADNITGGIAEYLEQSTGRIQDYLISMFDLTSRSAEIVGDFSVAFADIFSVFRGDEAKEITASIIQIFTDGFMGVTEIAGKLGTDILDTILSPITENADGFKEALSNTLGPMAEILGTLADSFTETWDLINAMYDEHIAPMFQSIKDGLSEIVGTLLDGYNTYLAPTLDSLAAKFSEVWDGSIQPLLNNFIDLFGEVATLVQNVWDNVLQPVVNWVASAIFPVVSPILEAVGTLVLDVFGGIADTLDGFITVAKGVVQFVSGVFAGDWEKAWEGVQNVFKGIWDAMPDFVKTPIRAVIGFINSMIGAVERGINSVVQAANGLSFDVPDWVPGIGGETFGFDFEKVSLPRIPQLAKGGVVTQSTLALIGENGAEAVMPLERNTAWISTLADDITSRMGGIPVIDVSMDMSKYRFKPMDINMDGLTAKFQEDMDVQMATLSGDLKRQNELLEDIVTAIDNKQLQIGDDDVFKATQRAQKKEYNRTFRTGWAGI